MTTLYGIKNCDTVKKARKWLEAHGVEYRFHDFRADGLEAKQIDAWIKAVGWETLLNRRGTTWRKLPEAVREGIDEKRAAALMLEHPTLIKRPVVEHGKQVLVGFDPDVYAKL
ncbi:ArsC family reductase [Thioalkalivibrio sulfidiphilus]|uniref:ArsC family reductase n=1 Tax=Thioalkalivibrio sulfidiphilus TaxID=1033854 RepID=UPI000362DC62|nr:ArsC family reductase [Thioalkalivibrio sulfidiphilus]